jgi:carbon monoxide dehydrogenase subunit G
VRIEGKFSLINVPVQTVYKSLLEPEILSLCIPGAEQIKRVDEKTYDCVIKQRVGPMSIKFGARNILTNVDPPKFIRLKGEGDIMGTSGKFDHDTAIELKEDDTLVEVCYSSDVNITGTFASIGNRLIKAKARTLEEEIQRVLQEKLQSLGNKSGSRVNDD